MSETMAGADSPFDVSNGCEFVTVDDAFLKTCRKITYKDIAAVVKEKLLASGYTLTGMELVNMKFIGLPLKDLDLYKPYKENYFSAYMLKLEKYGIERIGVYQPFGGQVGIYREDFVKKVSSLYGNQIQLVLKYYLQHCPVSNSVYVCQNSRFFKVKKRWFKDELMLKACGDHFVSHEISSKWKKAREAFESGEFFSEKSTKFPVMSL